MGFSGRQFSQTEGKSVVSHPDRLRSCLICGGMAGDDVQRWIGDGVSFPRCSCNCNCVMQAANPRSDRDGQRNLGGDLPPPATNRGYISMMWNLIDSHPSALQSKKKSGFDTIPGFGSGTFRLYVPVASRNMPHLGKICTCYSACTMTR